MKKRLQEMADNFSNYENFECYTGQGDDMVEYVEGCTNFASVFDAHNTDARTFTINATIGTTFAKSGIQLFGDLLVGAQNSNYADIAAASLDTGLSVTCNPKSIKQLYAYLQNSPCVLQGFQITSTNTAVVNGIIETHEVSPFRDLATDPINLSAYTNPYQYNANMVLVQNLNKVVSYQSYWLIPCVAGSAAYTITINLYFGPSLNMSRALDNKLTRAKSGILNMGGVAAARALGRRANVTTTNISYADLVPAAEAEVVVPDVTYARRAEIPAGMEINSANFRPSYSSRKNLLTR